MHKHHIVPRSRGGPDKEWNFVEVDPYTHAYEHALDFILFEHAPYFDCRHESWKDLPASLQLAVREEQSKRKKKEYLKDDLLHWGPEIELWYASGLSTRSIGSILGRSAPAINYHLKLRGVELQPPRKGKRGKDLKPRKKDGYLRKRQPVEDRGIQQSSVGDCHTGC